MQQLFHLESQWPLIPHPSVSTIKRGLTVGHTYSMKETEWGRITGTHGSINGTQYEWAAEPAAPAMMYGPTHAIQTKLEFNHSSVGWTWTKSSPVYSDILVVCCVTLMWDVTPDPPVSWIATGSGRSLRTMWTLRHIHVPHSPDQPARPPYPRMHFVGQ